MKKRGLAFFGAILILFSWTLPQDKIQSRAERVENQLLPPIPVKNAFKWNIYERLKYHKVPGVSVAVINNFQLDWAKAYGVLDTETKEPVTTSSLFQAASISKPVAALAVLKKVQDGRLGLDEDINNQLISWKLPDNQFLEKKKVTLKHLLSHSGGITVHGFRGYAVNEAVPTLLQILDGQPPANSAPIRVDMMPGTMFRYAGGGYCILQQVLLDLEKKTFPDIMRETVLGPLGMRENTYEQPLPADKLKFAAAGYRSDGSVVKGKRHTYPEMAAAGLWTTPSDLARFALEIQLSLKGKSNKVLSPQLVDQMLIPFLSPEVGLGLFIQKKGQAVYFSHSGGNEGFGCFFVAHKDKGYGVVVMTNSDHGFRLCQEIVRSVAREYQWEEYLPQEAEIVPIAPDQLNAFTGRYLLSLDEIIAVTEENGKLFLEGSYDEKTEILPVSENEFIGPQLGAIFAFVKNGRGINDEITIKVEGRVQKGKRIQDHYVAPYEYVLQGRFSEALEAYGKITKANPKDPLVAESRLNSLGYELLRRGEQDKAILMFRINTEQYPDSANTYDSLAEAYLGSGDKKNALKCYEKVLATIPRDPRPDKEALKALKSNAEEKAKELKEGQKLKPR